MKLPERKDWTDQKLAKRPRRLKKKRARQHSFFDWLSLVVRLVERDIHRHGWSPFLARIILILWLAFMIWAAIFRDRFEDGIRQIMESLK